MKLKVVTHGKIASVNLNGALTIGRPVEDLRKAVSGLIHRQISDIRINMSRVPYADASGLGALVACRVEAEAAGASLIVEGARGKVCELLDLMRLGGLRRREAATAHGEGSRAAAGSRRRAVFSFSMLAPRVA